MRYLSRYTNSLWEFIVVDIAVFQYTHAACYICKIYFKIYISKIYENYKIYKNKENLFELFSMTSVLFGKELTITFLGIFHAIFLLIITELNKNNSLV